MAAPSAMNKQSPEFVIVTDPQLLKRIGEITDHAVLKTAPAVIVVIANPEVGEDFSHKDCAAAAENIVLAATALGYAVGWIDGLMRNEECSRPLAELLGIPLDRRPSILIPVGKPAEESPRRSKKPFEQRASWNRYAIERSEG